MCLTGAILIHGRDIAYSNRNAMTLETGEDLIRLYTDAAGIEPVGETGRPAEAAMVLWNDAPEGTHADIAALTAKVVETTRLDAHRS